MIAGRLVWGVMRYLLAGLVHSTFTPALFLAGAVTTAIPGIILHIILIPALVIAMDKAPAPFPTDGGHFHEFR